MQAIFCILFAGLAFAAAYNEKKIVCYFSSWATFRQGNGKMNIDEINPHLCTHLAYQYVGVRSDGNVEVLDPHRDLSEYELSGSCSGFDRFNRLRGINPSLKTLVSIGGWSVSSEAFSTAVADATTRAVFVENVVKFVRMYGFDGLELYWVYPNYRGGGEADKQNFVLLLKKMKKRFDEERLILSAAVGALEHFAEQSYIIPEVLKYVNFVNLIAWDMHGDWDNKTGIIAPTYAGSWETDWEKKVLNVNATVHFWLSHGAPAEKLILGIPLYGRSFTLDNPNNNGIGAPAHKAGIPGPYVIQTGLLGYNEICEVQLAGGWEMKYQEEQHVPYTFKGDQWIGYENLKSVIEKAELINELGLGGAMVWSIDTDDFRGICGEKNPMLKTLNHLLRGNPQILPSTTTGNPRDDIPPTTTEDSSNVAVTCYTPGYIRDPHDCAVYYMCIQHSDEGFKTLKNRCPDGFFFDTILNFCNSANFVFDCTS